ncbi:MAG: hypothetical protein ABIY51_02065 [Ferruginibacter sp.]
MFRAAAVFCFLMFIIPAMSFAQTITYSDYHAEDDRNIEFEILGKIGQNYIIYKNIRTWKHILQVFDMNMKELSNDKLDYISDKTFNMDFIPYANNFYMVYQYQKKGVIYCNAVNIDSEGKKISGPVTLDTSRMNFVGSNEVYSTSYSEDKSKILIYKLLPKNSKLSIVTKLYDSNLILLDSTRRTIEYNERKELFTDFQVDNDGNIVYAKATRDGIREYLNQLEIITQAPHQKLSSTPVPLEKFYVDEIKIKIDNLNKTYILNSFYYNERVGNIVGLLVAVQNPKTQINKIAFNPFPDSLRSRISPGEYRFAFNDFLLKNIFVKKDGSFIIAAEDFNAVTRSNAPWNRWDNLYSNNPGGYYYNNSNYYTDYRYNRYNSPYGYGPGGRYNEITRYNYKNILIAGVDSSLKITWNNIILKSQTDEEKENFLSYGTMNSGNEIHFLFIDKERNSQIISNHSITNFGQIVRYPTLKSRETGYEFMPRLAKQVGLHQVIMPSIYRSYLVFAKIDF